MTEPTYLTALRARCATTWRQGDLQPPGWSDVVALLAYVDGLKAKITERTRPVPACEWPT